MGQEEDALAGFGVEAAEDVAGDGAGAVVEGHGSLVGYDGVSPEGGEPALEEGGAPGGGFRAGDTGPEGNLFPYEGVEGVGVGGGNRGGGGRLGAFRGFCLGGFVTGAPRQGEGDGQSRA